MLTARILDHVLALQLYHPEQVEITKRHGNLTVIEIRVAGGDLPLLQIREHSIRAFVRSDTEGKCLVKLIGK